MGNFHTCGPNVAMVKYGCGMKRPQYVAGGRVWIWSCFQQLETLSLQMIPMTIPSDNVYTKLGVAISCTGLARVKIEAKNPEMLRRAANQFLGKSKQQIQKLALETMEGRFKDTYHISPIEYF